MGDFISNPVAPTLFPDKAAAPSVTRPPGWTDANTLKAAEANALRDATLDIRATLRPLVYTDSGALPVLASGTTTARTLAQRAADFFFAADYGVAGNGTTDDTAALQACLNAAGVAQGIVVLTGMSRITAPLVPPLGVSIEGRGPKFGSGLFADGCQALTIRGDGFDGGWAFRQYYRDFMIRVKDGTAPSTGKLVELDHAYSIQFDNVAFWAIPDATTALDVTTCNDIGLTGCVIYGKAGNSTAKGVVTHGGVGVEATVRIVRPDFEVLFAAIENNDACIVDVVAPYLERNIIGVDNNATGAGGRVNVFGGKIYAANSSCYCVRSFGPYTFVRGTRLDPGTGTNTFYAGASFNGYWHDGSTNRVHIGPVAAAGILTPTRTFEVNPGAAQGVSSGIGMGGYTMYVGGSSDFPGDLVFQNPTGSKYARFFGSGAAELSLYTDGTCHANFALISPRLNVGTSQGGTVPWVSAGSATPEGAVSAPPGSLYLRTGGGAGTSFYVKETGTGNTGWVAK